MAKKKTKKQTNPIAKELRTEKFKSKVIPNKKKLLEKRRTKIKI
jgi:hypothetical protein|tara:strand:+ start:300 stop:431 length:132 start_codon:yes stop_codon:yes gene_type:complete